ncbi:MAG TPA: IS5 family transposase [Baekduia sp.]|nr:IS5 family transposase [Baekduia sp.]
MWQVRDELWKVAAPLVPVHEPDPRGGRPRVDDRVCFGAIVFVLFTGIAWQHLPRELGCSPATAHRRLKEWQAAGVFAALHRELLRRLNAAGLIDWSTAVVDGSHIRALHKGALTGPSPVDRARIGSKHHLLTDSSGIPLAISLTGGHRNDVTQLLPLVDSVGPVPGKVGRPRQRAERVLADRGYDHDKYRRELRKRGVKAVIARRATEHGSGLGRERWVVERTFAHLHNLRRLRTRYERDDQLHLAFMLIGCAVVSQRRLSPT